MSYMSSMDNAGRVPLTRGSTFGPKGGLDEKTFSGVALLGPNNGRSIQDTLGDRLNRVLSMGKAVHPAGQGKPDYVPGANGLFNGLANATGSVVLSQQKQDLLNKAFLTSQMNHTLPSLDLSRVSDALRGTGRMNAFGDREAVFERAVNASFTHWACLNPDSYPRALFTDHKKMVVHFPDMVFPTFVFMDESRSNTGSQPGTDTALKLPDINRIFYEQATILRGQKHPIFGDAFHNPKKFSEKFVPMNYTSNLQMYDSARDSTSVKLTYKSGVVKVPDLWLGCPRHGPRGHVYLQFVRLSIPVSADKVRKTVPGSRRIPTGNGDAYPTAEERAGTAVPLYQLVPMMDTSGSATGQYQDTEILEQSGFINVKDLAATGRLSLSSGRVYGHGRPMPRFYFGRLLDAPSVASSAITRFTSQMQDYMKPVPILKNKIPYENLPHVLLETQHISRTRG